MSDGGEERSAAYACVGVSPTSCDATAVEPAVRLGTAEGDDHASVRGYDSA
jgi:hypothetical protein